MITPANKKHSGLLAVMAIVGFASSAVAADLPAQPVYKSAAVAAPVANWTGFYVGLGGGYGLYDAKTSSASTFSFLGLPFATSSAPGTTGGKGYFGRVQVGYDYQFANQWILGAFADWDFSSIKGTITESIAPGLVPLKQTSAWGAGGRLGYLVTPQLLTFFDGGYASARFKGGPETFSNTCVGCATGAVGITLPSQTYNGYFLGGGTEFMISPGWFVKSEYRLASYGGKTTAALLGPPATTGFFPTTAASIAVKPVVQTISAELVYKFNWGR